MSTAVKEQYVGALTRARDLAAAAEKEDRELTADERQQIKGWVDEARGLKSQLDGRKADDDLRAQIADLGKGLAIEHPDGRSAGGLSVPTGKSLGEAFTDSDAFKAFLAQFPGGRVPESARGIRSDPVAFKSLFGPAYKTIVTGGTATSGGAFVNPDITGIYETLARRPLSLRDIVSNRQTTSDTVEFVRMTARVNAAATVAEATGATSGTAGTKPEGGLTFVKVTETVKTIAEWMPATKRALSDAAQIRGIIDDELRVDLEIKLEDLILDGDGTGENFTGILQTSGIQTQAYSATVSGLNPQLETLRKALTKMQTVAFLRPSAYVIAPADWETIDLARLVKNPYNEGAGNGVQTLFGVPVVVSPALTAGTALLGDFRRAVLWDREQASIQVSDSHSDFFVRNLVAILAEMRAAFGVTRPDAFVSIDLTA